MFCIVGPASSGICNRALQGGIQVLLLSSRHKTKLDITTLIRQIPLYRVVENTSGFTIHPSFPHCDPRLFLATPRWDADLTETVRSMLTWIDSYNQQGWLFKTGGIGVYNPQRSTRINTPSVPARSQYHPGRNNLASQVHREAETAIIGQVEPFCSSCCRCTNQAYCVQQRYQVPTSRSQPTKMMTQVPLEART